MAVAERRVIRAKTRPAAVSSATIAPGTHRPARILRQWCRAGLFSADKPCGRSHDKITSCAAMRMRRLLPGAAATCGRNGSGYSRPALCQCSGMNLSSESVGAGPARFRTARPNPPRTATCPGRTVCRYRPVTFCRRAFAPTNIGPHPATTTVCCHAAPLPSDAEVADHILIGHARCTSVAPAGPLRTKLGAEICPALRASAPARRRAHRPG